MQQFIYVQFQLVRIEQKVTAFGTQSFIWGQKYKNEGWIEINPFGELYISTTSSFKGLCCCFFNDQVIRNSWQSTILQNIDNKGMQYYLKLCDTASSFTNYVLRATWNCPIGIEEQGCPRSLRLIIHARVSATELESYDPLLRYNIA